MPPSPVCLHYGTLMLWLPVSFGIFLRLAIHKRLCRVIPDKWTCIRLTEYLPYATCDQLNNCPD